MPYPRIPIAERFAAKIHFNARWMPHMSTPCHEWTGAAAARGYGHIKNGVLGLPGFAENDSISVTHLALELDGRPIKPGEYACHRCDNPPCVRSDHLFGGTPADNAQDCIAKGRNPHTSSTHCKRGHPLSGGNLRLRDDRPNARICFACSQIREAKRVR